MCKKIVLTHYWLLWRDFDEKKNMGGEYTPWRQASLSINGVKRI